MKHFYKWLGSTLILVGTIGTVLYLAFDQQVIALLAQLISPDGHISQGGKNQLDLVVYFWLMICVVAGILCLRAQDDAWRYRVEHVLWVEPLTNGQSGPSPKRLFWISSILGLALMINIRLYDVDSSIFRILYLEDGVFEYLTSILVFSACLLLIPATVRLRREARSRRLPHYPYLVYFCLIIAFFLFAMEEISWGQRLFGWSTPAYVAQGNVQNETNIHNYFNEYFLAAYRVLVLLPLPILLSIWLDLKQRAPQFSHLILPRSSLLGLGTLIAFVAFVWPLEQELLEEMVAVFVFFYSFRIFSCFRLDELNLVSMREMSSQPASSS